ncbi:MAG: hypothetical protein ACJAXJ_000279 [Colwellia sp.]|jgi:hypothetical protein
MNNDEDKSTTSQANPKKDTAHNETSHEDHSADRKAEAEESVKKQNENIDEQNIEKTWHNKNVLKRGIAMLGYGFVAGFVRLGITLIALFQFFSLLFAEKPNQPLVKFGQDLNTYLYQINQFLTINSETYPFPFADWPDSPPK